VFGISRNDCSASSEIGVRLQPKSLYGLLFVYTRGLVACLITLLLLFRSSPQVILSLAAQIFVSDAEPSTSSD